MKKITIVVPCYNIVEYIEQFEKNIKNQTIHANLYEVIFIDDLSTDDSYIQLKKLMNRNSEYTIKVEKLQMKGGAGGARNKGLEISEGEYIMFLDMDDEFSGDYIEKMLTKIEEENADLAICEYYGITQDNKKIHYSMKDYAEGRKDKFLMGPAPWNKIYRSEFLKSTKIEFQSLLRHQDLGTTPKWMYKAKKIAYLLEPIYFYKIAQPGSITLKTSNFNEDIYMILDDLYGFFKDKDETIGEKLIYNHLVTRHLYYGNHNLIDCIKHHRFLMNYLITKYPDFKKSKNFQELDIIVKLPYYFNYYTKGIGSGIMFKFIKKFNFERFLYKYE